MLVPVAPSNGSLAPLGDTEPGRKAETSFAPQVFASYRVLGRKKVEKCTHTPTLQTEMSSMQLCHLLSGPH